MDKLEAAREARLKAEIAQARAEMIRHLSQRIGRIPRKLVKRFMQDGARHVWRPCLVTDKQLQHFSGRGR